MEVITTVLLGLIVVQLFVLWLALRRWYERYEWRFDCIYDNSKRICGDVSRIKADAMSIRDRFAATVKVLTEIRDIEAESRDLGKKGWEAWEKAAAECEQATATIEEIAEPLKIAPLRRFKIEFYDKEKPVELEANSFWKEGPDFVFTPGNHVVPANKVKAIVRLPAPEEAC